MKITRERLEEILGEELAAVAEGAFSDMSAGAGRFHPKYAGSKQAEKDADEAAALRAKRGPGAFDNMRPEEPDDAFKGLSTKDITIGESITEGMGQTLANTIREMLEAAVEELGKMHETGSAEYKAAMETLRREVKLALGKDDLQEAVSAMERSDQIRAAAAKCRNAGKQFDHSELRAVAPDGKAIPFDQKLKNACKDKVKEGYSEEEHTPMMPPKAIKKKGIDVPLTKLADGADAARAAVEAMYSPSSREYARAMMVIDMAEAQGALDEGELE